MDISKHLFSLNIVKSNDVAELWKLDSTEP